MTKLGPQKKKWRSCIFCPSTDVSKEHFWPEWMHPILRAHGGSTHHTETAQSFTDKVGIPVGKPYEVTRQGSTFTKKIRAACSRCNNGWMNVLERDARPWLTPLVEGRAVSLSPDAQRTIASWITLKTMVAEYNRRHEDVTPRADRHAFRLSRTIPPWFRIQIAYHADWRWSGMYWRHAATFTRNPAPIRFATSKNLQHVSFGVGSLFVNVVAGYVVEPDEMFRLDAGFFPRIHPTPATWLQWPQGRAISAMEMNLVAESLDHFIAEHPRLLWKPFPEGADPTRD
jgi:hypothetical protein